MNTKSISLLIFFAVFGFACGQSNDDDGDALNSFLLLQQSGQQTTDSTTPATKRTYMTNMIYTGNLSGIAGADIICNSDGFKPNLAITWKAVLVDGTNRVACTTANCGGGTSEHTDWVLTPNTTYTNAAGNRTLFTTNANGIHDFGSGNLTGNLGDTGESWWSGLNTDWTTNATNCSTWTSTTGNGVKGDGFNTTGFALNATSGTCNLAFQSLLCVEQ